jgi:hypothetical protein
MRDEVWSAIGGKRRVAKCNTSQFDAVFSSHVHYVSPKIVRNVGLVIINIIV